MFVSYANKVRIGDEVLVHRNGELAAEKVINMSILEMPGTTINYHIN